MKCRTKRNREEFVQPKRMSKVHTFSSTITYKGQLIYFPPFWTLFDVRNAQSGFVIDLISEWMANEMERSIKFLWHIRRMHLVSLWCGVLRCMRLCHYVSIWKHADVWPPAHNKSTLPSEWLKTRWMSSLEISQNWHVSVEWLGRGIEALFKCFRTISLGKVEVSKVKFKYKQKTGLGCGRRRKNPPQCSASCWKSRSDVDLENWFSHSVVCLLLFLTHIKSKWLGVLASPKYDIQY